MDTEKAVAVSFWLSTWRRYMSSTFSKSTSAFHRSWSMCLQAALPFFFAFAGSLPAPSDFCFSLRPCSSFWACCRSCVVCSTSSCIRRISISSSWASSSWTKTLAYAGPWPVRRDRSTSISAAAWWSRRATCWLMVFSLSRSFVIFVSSCAGVCVTISMQSSRPTCPFSFTSGSFVSLIATLFFSSAFRKRLEWPRSSSLEISRFLKWYRTAFRPVTQWSNSNSSLQVKSSVFEPFGPYTSEKDRCSSMGRR
mmetsp:Transcript_105685/g.298934  ORF Transcript_105685/g.298934 Transcript_105685/m.298934 type:complete len:252 (+) Transcript_105685:217-972(+)